MNPNKTQGQGVNNEMSPEEAKASLGHSTALIEQMLAMQNPQPEVAEQSPQEQAEPQPDMIQELDTLRTQFQTELSGAREETKKIIEDEMTKLRTDIKDALNQENEQS